MNVVDEIQCSTTTHCAEETNWKRVASELSDFFFLLQKQPRCFLKMLTKACIIVDIAIVKAFLQGNCGTFEGLSIIQKHAQCLKIT